MSNKNNSLSNIFTSFTNSRYNEKSEADITEVLEKSKINTTKSIKVASLGIVTQVGIDNDDTRTYVKLLPVPSNTASAEEQQISVYVAQSVGSLTKGDVVVIVFTDLDFRSCYDNYKTNPDEDRVYTTSNENLTHNKQYGIVVALMYRATNTSKTDSSNSSE